MEEWRSAPGYEGLYEVSDRGSIRSLPRKCFACGREGSGFKVLKVRVMRGYHLAKLKSKNVRVHRLVAAAFIDNPQNKPLVNHKDSNRLNNRVSNLEWVTHTENMRHGRLAAASRAAALSV